MSFTLDPANPDQARALEHLSTDLIAWLTTISSKGRPQPSAIWFSWDGNSVLLYSGDTARVKNISSNPNVSFHFNSDEEGDDIAILSGIATLDPDAPPPNELASYRKRYEVMVSRMGMTWDSFADQYHIPIRITLTGYRRW